MNSGICHVCLAIPSNDRNASRSNGERDQYAPCSPFLSEEKEKIVSANEDRQGQGSTDFRAYRSIQLWMDVVNKMYHLSEEEWGGACKSFKSSVRLKAKIRMR